MRRGHLYVSCLRRGQWTEPVNLGPPVNTADDEFHPTLSRGGRTLYFARTVFSPELVPSDFNSIPTKALRVTLRRCWLPWGAGVQKSPRRRAVPPAQPPKGA